ncbi:hypothetical protein KFE98_18670 [bacterium SCSIO 12741]|nr:hypothetical protein KFE98_18670 [bacterium SCSIO 12741]
MDNHLSPEEVFALSNEWDIPQKRRLIIANVPIVRLWWPKKKRLTVG